MWKRYGDILNSIKSQMVIDYITKVNKAISNSMVVVEKEDIFDLLIEIANVFQNEIPEIQSSILLRNGTETRDANTVVGLLKLYLANNNIEYKEDDEENREIKRFWASFILWFETELINLDLLKDKYLRWDNWDGGTWYLELDYDYEFKLYRGIGYPDSLKNKHTINIWPQYKRVLQLYKGGNWEYLTQEIKKIFPEDFIMCRNELEIIRAVRMIEVHGFLLPLKPEIISLPEIGSSILKLEKEQINSFIEYLNSHDGYGLNQMQEQINVLLGEFIETFPYLVPAFSLQFCEEEEENIDFETEGTTTSTYDDVKQFYLDTYETLGNLLIIPAAIDNIKNRDDANNFINNDAGIVSLDKFITSSKAHRFRLYNTNEIYMRTIDVRYNQKLRNAIGHNDVEYETSTQKIIYIPDPRKREKKLSEYLLEFEIEALSMFKTVLVISEYLYRLRELELLSKGVKPLPVEFPTKERRKEKIYPNEKCPCGSGLKYKKCHGRIF